MESAGLVMAARQREGGGEGGGKFIQGLNAVNEQDPERERAKGIRHALKRERERERERERFIRSLYHLTVLPGPVLSSFTVCPCARSLSASSSCLSLSAAVALRQLFS